MTPTEDSWQKAKIKDEHIWTATIPQKSLDKLSTIDQVKIPRH